MRTVNGNVFGHALKSFSVTYSMQKYCSKLHLAATNAHLWWCEQNIMPASICFHVKNWGGKWLCDESAVLGFRKQRFRIGLYPVFGRCPFPTCLHAPGCPAAMGRAHALILVEHSAPEEKTLQLGMEGSHTFPKTISYSLKHFLSKLLDCYFTAFRVSMRQKIKPDFKRKYPTEPEASDKQS